MERLRFRMGPKNDTLLDTPLNDAQKKAVSDILQQVGVAGSLGVPNELIRKLMAEMILLPEKGYQYSELSAEDDLTMRLKKLSILDNVDGILSVKFEPTPDLSDPVIRKSTYRIDWYSMIVDLQDLVDAGFYWDNDCRVLRCYACPLSFDTWKVGALPLQKHIDDSPNCPLIPELKKKLQSFKVIGYWNAGY